ncbi:uncharacterized protein LOC116774764 [Danaus plexippus]|uniref:uncharacterized protein LOC116774764 n=1 Tax=Danaus plexippus TaxID=13037 RepID=UPI002AAF9B0B|nr:uncharacterized protein LOC116774764 [Danaus plexippus]
MAKVHVLVLVVCQILCLPTLCYSDDDNPFLDLASSFIQNMASDSGKGNNMDGLAAIGNIVGSLMQGDNAKNLGSLFGQENGGAGDVLSGLGSLFGGQDGKIDPAVIGSVVSMFASQMGSNQNQRRKRESDTNDINLDSILSMASGFLGNKNAAGMLPLVMNALSSFSEDETSKRADSHKDHASFLPPFLEKAHLYWDIFINSELGKAVWEKSGFQRAMKSFMGPDGKVSFELMFKNFENHSFRRHWIKAVAKYLTGMVVHVSKPEVYQRYLSTVQYVLNGFLSSQGLPKNTHFNMKKPEESITVLSNYIAKKYLDVNTDVSSYVKSAVDYVKQTLKMAQSASESLASRDYSALAERLTDTLNMDVIEPVLRVYRAYTHARTNPHCQEHLMCLVNRQVKQGGPGFKAGLTKMSSLAACAALSFENGRGFWDLYNAVQADVDCEAKYPADCSSFHEHELKVTTEVYHSEL